MDLDAEVKKIRNFMADMHAIFPGGVDGLKAAAAAARNGEPMRSVGDMPQPQAQAPFPELERFMELGARLESLLPEIESLMGGIGDVIGRVASLEEAVTKLEQSKDGSADAAGAADGEVKGLGDSQPGGDPKASLKG